MTLLAQQYAAQGALHYRYYDFVGLAGYRAQHLTALALAPMPADALSWEHVADLTGHAAHVGDYAVQHLFRGLRQRLQVVPWPHASERAALLK